MPVQILGIVNVTRDSFSDGGEHLAPRAAIKRALRLADEGAAYIDVGAESTHPDAEDVPAEAEIARLTPVVQALKAEGLRVSVDTYKPPVIRAMLALGADLINDVTAARDPASVAALRDADVPIILMHSTAPQARAQRADVPADEITTRVRAFFEQRLAALEAAGLDRRRLILDPGMGFFLGRDPELSLRVLRDLPALAAFGRPLCVCTSRKSFLGTLLGRGEQPRPVRERAAATLATELWAAAAGMEYIRTHEVRPLADALRIWDALRRDAGA